MNIRSIVSKMTLEDKISLCTGADFWHSKAMEQYGIPAFMMSDGPHGLRCQSGEADMIGINNSLPATCFPTVVIAGAAWDVELYAAEGAAIGEEALAHGVDAVLGPGCNIKRNPLCGRTFEYLSGDPYLAGKLAAAFDVDAHHALARKVAEAGAVLLKNEGGILPAKAEDMVLIGYMAKEFRYQGAGSSAWR